MMEYFELGEPLEYSQNDELYTETVALLKACRENPYITVREIRSELLNGSRTEFIIIDAGDGTVASGNPAGIRRKERLAIGINRQLRVPIVVHTLRQDFPALSHQHARLPGRPRVLCLYETAWSTVELSWTPERFIVHMFWWLRESAQLSLHRDDQPLEQLFYLSPYRLILPANYADYALPGSETLVIFKVNEGESITLKAVPRRDAVKSKPVRMLSIDVAPVDSATVVTFPETLGHLEEQLVSWGSDLAERLYQAVFDAIPTSGIATKGKDEGLLVLLWVPRDRDGEIERVDVMGYMISSSLFELALAFDMLGLPEPNGNRLRVKLIGCEGGTEWRELPLFPVEVRSALNAEAARDLSAIPEGTSDFHGVLAGVGALGGALADMWIRQGWGRWTFIDPDLVLPHNLCRHVAFDDFVGLYKVHVLQELAKAIYPHEPPPKAIAKSIIDSDDDITHALSGTQLIVDVTTTLEVPRELASKDCSPRTVSLFLTPSGQSSVMILEDADRHRRVDVLEGQYYRAVLASEFGSSHLVNHLGNRWVGGGCRDISVRMSNECIHVHAGILSRQLRQSVSKPEARVCIWTHDESSGGVTAHEVQLFDVVTYQSGGWTVKLDQGLIQKVRSTRKNALPNETGGAIIGLTDFKAKTIIIVDVLPAPADSESSPLHFIRGKQGQVKAIEEVHRRTARVVDYVGDWHSHPEGASALASADDVRLLDILHRRMSVDGLPAVMLIVSRDDLTVTVR